MKRLILFTFSAALVFGQVAFRTDPNTIFTTPGNTPAGASAPMYAVPGVSIQLCSSASCASPAVAYTDGSATTPCPSNAAVTLPGSSFCQTTTSAYGQFGFWLLPGTYWYKATLPSGQVMGPAAITVGGSGGGGGGSGTVTSWGVGTIPSIFNYSITNTTTTPTFTFGYAAGQISHQVLGTCGTATSFQPCSLVPADIPILNQSTTGTAGGLTAAYVDWNATSGGAFIQNKPIIPTISGSAPLKGSSGNAVSATSSDIIGLWNSGTCTGYLKSTGSCDSGTGSGSTSSQLLDFTTTKTSTVLSTAAGVARSGTSTYVLGAVTYTLSQYAISSISAASQAILTLASSLPSGMISNGDTISISGVGGSAGCSGLNGLQAIVNWNGSTGVTVAFDSTAKTCTGGTFGSNPSATGVAYEYANYDGTIHLELPAAAGLLVVGTGSFVSQQTTTPSFPSGSSPIAIVSINATGNGNWNVVTDKRGFMSNVTIQAGTGMVSTEAGGINTVAIDPAVVPRLGQTNVWTGANDFSAATSVIPAKAGTSLPGTCADGQAYIKTDAAAGAQWYICHSNTWTAQGGTGGSGSFDYTVQMPACSGNGGSPRTALFWDLLAGGMYADAASFVSCFIQMLNGQAYPLVSSGIQIPLGWPGTSIGMKVYGYSNDATGNIKLNVQTFCVNNTDLMYTSSTTFNAAQSVTVALGTVNHVGSFDISNLTKTGCVAGGALYLMITRDSTVGGNAVGQFNYTSGSLRFQ